MIRRNDDNKLKKAMMLEVNGQRKRGRPKMTWRRQVVESMKKVGLKIEEVADRTRWRKGVRSIAEGMRVSGHRRWRGKKRSETGDNDDKDKNYFGSCTIFWKCAVAKTKLYE